MATQRQCKRVAAIAAVTLGYLMGVPLMASKAGQGDTVTALGYRDRAPGAPAPTQPSRHCDRAPLGSRTVQLAVRSRGDGPWQSVVVLGNAACTSGQDRPEGHPPNPAIATDGTPGT
ncbi:MAG: hypothetical protein Fur0042_05460 [Cyanophyceae cyanobacterium]